MTNQKCLNRGCPNPVEQALGGHRQRLYCSPRCRQAAFRERHRPEEKERKQRWLARMQEETSEIERRYHPHLFGTIELLRDLQRRDPVLADQVGHWIVRERESAGTPPEEAEPEKVMAERAQLRELRQEAKALEDEGPNLSEHLWKAYTILEYALVALMDSSPHRAELEQIIYSCNWSILGGGTSQT